VRVVRGVKFLGFSFILGSLLAGAGVENDELARPLANRGQNGSDIARDAPGDDDDVKLAILEVNLLIIGELGRRALGVRREDRRCERCGGGELRSGGPDARGADRAEFSYDFLGRGGAGGDVGDDRGDGLSEVAQGLGVGARELWDCLFVFCVGRRGRGRNNRGRKRRRKSAKKEPRQGNKRSFQGETWKGARGE
jgi:hypothetical protein